MQDPAPLSSTGPMPMPPRARRRTTAWLPSAPAPADREYLRDLTLLGGAFFALTLIAYIVTTTWTLPFPRDRTTLIVGRDFLNLWMYGRAIFDADPARFYDVVTYNAELLKLLGPGYPGQNWPNPPTALAVMMPFGLLGYFPALLAWFTAGLVALIAVGRRQFTDPRALVIVLLSPAALLCLISGQSSFLTTAAMIGAFACLDRRPVLAGVLIGLMTLKPQLGLLFPFALLASQRWRVFASAAVTAVGLVALSCILFGPDVWVAYVTKALPLQRAVMTDSAATAVPFHATPFMNLRGLLGDSIASVAQGAFTVGAVAAVAWAFHFKRNADPAMLRALFFACTLCASPYMSTYDALPLTFAAVALLAEGKLDGTGRRLAQLVFWIPALQLFFGTVHIPGPGLIAPAFAIYLVMRLRGDSRALSGGIDRAAAGLAT